MPLLDSPSVGWLLVPRLLLPFHLRGDADWDLALAAALKSSKPRGAVARGVGELVPLCGTPNRGSPKLGPHIYI